MNQRQTAAHLLLFLCQLLFQCGKLAVGELSCLLQVTLSLGDLNVGIYLVNLFAELAELLNGSLLIIPLGLLFREVCLQLRQFLLELLQSFLT